MRSRTPTSRKPSERCKARLASFSMKMPAWSVQSPPARAARDHRFEQRPADAPTRACSAKP